MSIKVAQYGPWRIKYKFRNFEFLRAGTNSTDSTILRDEIQTLEG